MTTEEKNKAACKMLGIHWHEEVEVCYAANDGYSVCNCGATNCSLPNPDFSTDAGAVQLLRELAKQKWYLSFMAFSAENLLNEEYFELVTTPGLLLDKVYEWKERTVK